MFVSRIDGMSLSELRAEKQNLQRTLNASGYCCLCHFFDKCRYGDADNVIPSWDDSNPKYIYHERSRNLTWIAQIDAKIKIVENVEQTSQARIKRQEHKILDYYQQHPNDPEARKAAHDMGLLNSSFQPQGRGVLRIADEPTPGLPEERSCTTLAYVCLALAAVAALVALAATALFFFPVLSLSSSLVLTALKVSTGAFVAFGLAGTVLKLCCY